MGMQEDLAAMTLDDAKAAVRAATEKVNTLASGAAAAMLDDAETHDKVYDLWRLALDISF